MKTKLMDEERILFEEDELKQHIEEILNQESRQTPEVLRKLAWYLELLATLIEKRNLNGKNSEKESVYSTYAIRYIQTHFKEKIRVQELAEHIGVSRSYLTKLMRKEAGMSPQEYLVSVRMEYARQNLLNTDHMIRDIASDCGYDDALAFSKAFKRKFGISPSEYRNQSRNGENTLM